MSQRCQLISRRRRAGASLATIVALHRDGSDVNGLWPFCAALGARFEIVALQAPRARDPFHASAAPNDPRWGAYSGYSWFRRDDAGRPEPASFGDSLSQLEAALLELESDPPVFLVGQREGATLARAAALAFPERLAALVALDGEWPVIAGWSELLRPPAGLSILELEVGDADPLGAADRVRVFLEARREGARHGRSRSQEADQDLLQAHSNG